MTIQQSSSTGVDTTREGKQKQGSLRSPIKTVDDDSTENIEILENGKLSLTTRNATSRGNILSPDSVRPEVGG